MRAPKIKAVSVLIILAVFSMPVTGYSLTSTEVEAELMCTCGCTMVLNTCSCGTSDEMRAVISGMIDGGKSKEQIVQWHLTKYGETILAAPLKKGFNIIAYTAPWVGLLFGVGIAVVLVRKWVLPDHGGEDEDGEDGYPNDLLSDEMQSRIDHELESIEEG